MNFYKHHLGDYMRATSHLSMLEDAAYRRLLDAYYVREAPIPSDIKQACRLARASSSPEREAVETVLQEFFELHEDGWHNSRADQEIAFAQAKAGKNREVGKLGGRPPKVETKKVSENNHDGSETETQTVPKNNPSHKPVTSNQKRITTASAEAEPDFDEAWNSYPKRAGGNPKNRALKAWRARRKEGATAKEITEGVIRYAAFIRATGREHTEFVMQAATFYGPDRQFAEPWNPPQESRKPVEWWSSDAAAEAKGLELGISPRAGEGWPQFKDRIRAKLNERMAA